MRIIDAGENEECIQAEGLVGVGSVSNEA